MQPVHLNPEMLEQLRQYTGDPTMRDKIMRILKGIANTFHPIFKDAPNYYRDAEKWYDSLIAKKILENFGHNLPYIATTAIVGFAFMLMATGDTNRWLGKIMISFWLAVAIKMILPL